MFRSVGAMAMSLELASLGCQGRGSTKPASLEKRLRGWDFAYSIISANKTGTFIVCPKYPSPRRSALDAFSAFGEPRVVSRVASSV